MAIVEAMQNIFEWLANISSSFRLTYIQEHGKKNNQTKPPVEGIDEIYDSHYQIKYGGCYGEYNVVE